MGQVGPALETPLEIRQLLHFIKATADQRIWHPENYCLNQRPASPYPTCFRRVSGPSPDGMLTRYVSHAHACSSQCFGEGSRHHLR